MRPRDEGSTFVDARNGAEERRQDGPMSSHAIKDVSRHHSHGQQRRSTTVYESYPSGRQGSPPRSRTTYESYRPGNAHSPPRLRNTFRRDSREDDVRIPERQDPRDRQPDGRDGPPFHRNYERRDDYSDRFSSSVPHFDDRRPEPSFPAFGHLSRPVPQKSLPPATAPSARFPNRTWIRPASEVPQPVKSPLAAPMVESRTELRNATAGSTPPILSNPPVAQSVKQSPHVFIPAACLPVDQSTIKNLEGLRAKSLPTEAGSRNVFMDDTGYFVTFPDHKHGNFQQAMWLRTNQRTKVFGKYRLNSMISFPYGQSRNANNSSPSGAGRSRADMTPVNGRRRNENEERARFRSPDASFNIKGAAAIGSRNSATPQGDEQDEFAIRGAASTLSPRFSTKSPNAESSSAVRKQQAHHGHPLASPQVASPDSVLNKAVDTDKELHSRAGSILRQDRDDAASSTSGAAGSDVSASKSPKCHICETRTDSSVIKCPTCTRHYHSHCHTDPPIPQDVSDEWQCRRCKYKGVSLKRNPAQIDNSDLGPSVQKKQRLSIPDTPQPSETVGALCTASGPNINAHPASSSAAPQVIQTSIDAANASNASLANQQLDPNNSDDGADNLVAKSFANAFVEAAPKKAAKLKVVKHKISNRGLEDQGEHANVSASILAVDQTHLTADAASGPHPNGSDPRGDTYHHHRNQSSEPQNNGPEKATTVETNDTLFATKQDRVSDGKKAKKTQGSMKMKCSSCKVHAVPHNPFGRTICQLCKDAEAKANQSSEPKTTDQASRLVLGSKAPEREPGRVGDVEPASVAAGETEDDALNSLPTIMANNAVSTTADPARANSATVDAATTNLDAADAVMTDIATVEAATAHLATADPAAAAPMVEGPPAVIATGVSVPAELHDQAARSDWEVGSFDTPPPRGTLSSGSSLSDIDTIDHIDHIDSSDSTDEDDDVALSTLKHKRALNPKLESKNSARMRKKTVRQNQVSIAKDEFDLGNSSKRPKNTYKRLIHMAISEAPEGRLRSNDITQWISDNVPGYTLGSEGWRRWAGGIKSTLIFLTDNSGKNPDPTLKRYGPGGHMNWYEILPKWKDKLDRWDAARARPVSKLVREHGGSLNGNIGRAPPARKPANEVSHKLPTPTQSTGLLKSIVQPRTKQGRRSAQEPALDEMMEIDSNFVAEPTSSPEEPLARVAAELKAVAHDKSIDDLVTENLSDSIENPAPIVDNEDHDDLFVEVPQVPHVADSVGDSRSAAKSAKRKSFSIHDITLDQVLARRPTAVHTELYKAWPSLDPKKTNFDYDKKVAEIRARPGRKARFGQENSVDTEHVLADVGPSELPTWPPIDNSLGLTQEQFGDELALQRCKTWDEFFGTTEQAKPCIVDGKLAYRPVGEKSRTVYKTTI